jgi:hypothetical protein
VQTLGSLRSAVADEPGRHTARDGRVLRLPD